MKLIYLLFLFQLPTWGFELVLPASSDKSHEYYHELLARSLADIGELVSIRAPYQHLPQKRAKRLLEHEKISLFWMIESERRNQRFVPVKVGLTQGLIGKRILLVPRKDKEAYKQVTSLQQFRQLKKIGGFGKGWFDIDVWQANELEYMVRDGEWRALYSMLSVKGGVNYFSRGVNEIAAEQKLYPYLAIEPYLMFEYKRDFIFYLSKHQAHLAPILEKALKQAESSGLIDTLVEKYWGTSLAELDLDKRIKLKLQLPKPKKSDKRN